MKSKGSSETVAPAPAKASAPRPSPAKKEATPTGPPVCELRGKKWVIENQSGPDPVTVEGTALSQIVQIFGCRNSTIVIKGKVSY